MLFGRFRTFCFTSSAPSPSTRRKRTKMIRQVDLEERKTKQAFIFILSTQINKQTEKMYVLLSVSLVLHPQRIDESLQAILREKPHAERIMRMQKGELQVRAKSNLKSSKK